MEYTPKEVAEKLGVSERLVTLYLNRGKIRGFKVSPRKWIIPEVIISHQRNHLYAL